MIENSLLAIAVVLLTGLLCSKLAKKVKLPNITGYLIGGVLIGPSLAKLITGGNFGGIISESTFDGLNICCKAALGFIAISIGSSFKISYFKRVGSKPVVIAILESLGATIIIFGSFMLYSLIDKNAFNGQPLVFALVMSAIAAATAPAATLLVVKQYKARGEVTDNLLSVVAIDDAVALAIYGFNMTFATKLYSGGSGSLALSLLSPFIDIGLSLLIGIILGIILVLLLKLFSNKSNRLCCVIAAVFAGISICQVINGAFNANLSELLCCMMTGAVIANFSKAFEEVVDSIDRFTPPIYMLFFVVSGAELQLQSVATVGIIGAIYIVLRVFGKYFGARLGSKITKAGKNCEKYMGWCLMPQEGVALALSAIAAATFGDVGSSIRTITLCATLVYELIGPFVVKKSLQAAGEIEIEPKKVKEQIEQKNN